MLRLSLLTRNPATVVANRLDNVGNPPTVGNAASFPLYEVLLSVQCIILAQTVIYPTCIGGVLDAACMPCFMSVGDGLEPHFTDLGGAKSSWFPRLPPSPIKAGFWSEPRIFPRAGHTVVLRLASVANYAVNQDSFRQKLQLSLLIPE